MTRNRQLTHASLFSGIGGFDLAAHWMGWENIFHCEINPFGRRVLEYHFPRSHSYGDINAQSFKQYKDKIDVLTGGFPCQPFSVAGKRLGKEDERHLWPSMLRVIREVRPRWIVGENVLGIISWSEGLVFEEVCLDLEAIGYEVQAYVIPACGVDAPHKRDRVWFVAHANRPNEIGNPRKCKGKVRAERLQERHEVQFPQEPIGLRADLHPHGQRREKIIHESDFPAAQQAQGGKHGRAAGGTGVPGFEQFPTQPPFRGGDDGLSSRLDRISFPKWRDESIKGYGNAVVPQVVYRIFETIAAYEKTCGH